MYTHVTCTMAKLYLLSPVDDPSALCGSRTARERGGCRWLWRGGGRIRPCWWCYLQDIRKPSGFIVPSEVLEVTAPLATSISLDEIQRPITPHLLNPRPKVKGHTSTSQNPRKVDYSSTINLNFPTRDILPGVVHICWIISLGFFLQKLQLSSAFH